MIAALVVSNLLTLGLLIVVFFSSAAAHHRMLGEAFRYEQRIRLLKDVLKMKGLKRGKEWTRKH